MTNIIKRLPLDLITHIFIFLDICESIPSLIIFRLEGETKIKKTWLAKSNRKIINSTWFVNNKKHRFNGPAQIEMNVKYWYYNNTLHRIDGPAIEGPNYEGWYLNGEKHRIGAPAVIHKIHEMYKEIVSIEYWVNGECHRDNGPAVHYADLREYWRNGVLILREDIGKQV